MKNQIKKKLKNASWLFNTDVCAQLQRKLNSLIKIFPPLVDCFFFAHLPIIIGMYVRDVAAMAAVESVCLLSAARIVKRKMAVAEMRGPVLKAFSVWCVTRALITFLKKRLSYVYVSLSVSLTPQRGLAKNFNIKHMFHHLSLGKRANTYTHHEALAISFASRNVLIKKYTSTGRSALVHIIKQN